jgi:hypothetical protein
MTNETMDKVRDILLKARALGMRSERTGSWLDDDEGGQDMVEIEELMWEILLMSMPSEDPSRDDLMVVAELTDAESEAAALAWVEAHSCVEDEHAYESRGYAWRQVL